MSPSRPQDHVPEPMNCSQPGTFAHKSIHERLPSILDRVISDHAYPESIRSALLALKHELINGAVRTIQPGSYSDGSNWGSYTQPYLGLRWDELPWFFAETYFYRRLLEAVAYFDVPEDARIDPFHPQKTLALQTSQSSLIAFAARTRKLIHSACPDHLREMFFLDLWSNRADLSIWPASNDSSPVFNYNDQAPLLIDDSRLLQSHLQHAGGEASVDLVLDNAGLELIGDLFLSVYLLETELARRVVLHAKAHPTFVSDTTAGDIEATLHHLLDHEDDNVAELGRRLNSHHLKGRLVVTRDPYWNSPLAGWDMPATTRTTLSRSTLVLVKGDANYRRLLGDRQWPFSTPFEEVCGYFPAPLGCLRALKSEVLAGLTPDVEADVRAQSANVITSGTLGILQSLLPDG